MAKRPLNVHVPGEPLADAAATVDTAVTPEVIPTAPPEQDLEVHEGAATAAPAVMRPLPDPKVIEDAKKDAQLAAEVAKTADLVGSDKALDWSHLTQPNIINAKINPNAPDDGLPFEHEVNPAKLPFGQKVLTKGGWVLSTAADPNPPRR